VTRRNGANSKQSRMEGHLSLVLHAHLPFVRHPEHERFLEENWLFEAMTETYLPLLAVLEGWRRDQMRVRLTLSLTPTLCAMLLDQLLQDRYERYLRGLIELAEKETFRTLWDPELQPIAQFYLERLTNIRERYFSYGRNLVAAFAEFQNAGSLEIITSAATHAVLPLLSGPSIRAQVLIAVDQYRSCFGCDPRGFWLPECAYSEDVEPALQEAGIHWFLLDSHGVLLAKPAPRYQTFAPIYTTNGLAAFGRDLDSAKQVWSRDQGYPGDPHYRDFYRDIGFDLDYEYLQPYLPAPPQRSFTGIKYHRITGAELPVKAPYRRDLALERAAAHADHFLRGRIEQLTAAAALMDRPPLIVSPYDAELFGHWWYEGPEFVDYLFRKLFYDQSRIVSVTPSDYLREWPSLQIAQPSASSWGEEGYWKVWLNPANEWIFRHVRVAQEKMAELAREFSAAAEPLMTRALKQAGRELLLAQASDWPFIVRTGTSPDYARRRVEEHLTRFWRLHGDIAAGQVDRVACEQVESVDNLFPELDYRSWRHASEIKPAGG